MSPPGTYLTAASTEAMPINCFAQGHNILMLPGLNRRSLCPETDILPNMTNMPVYNNTSQLLITMLTRSKAIC